MPFGLLNFVLFCIALFNSNNEKHLLKIIAIGDINYIYYIIYGSTTTAIANLILLANTGPRVKFHFQLPSSLVLWSYQKKITCAMFYECGDLHQQRLEDQTFISLHLQANQLYQSFTTNVRSSNS